VQPRQPEPAASSSEDGSFDVERFRAAARIFITAQEILVDNAGLPLRPDREELPRLPPARPRLREPRRAAHGDGAPYDSDEGRAVAGAVMAIEHCEAYARSAEIAANERSARSRLRGQPRADARRDADAPAASSRSTPRARTTCWRPPARAPRGWSSSARQYGYRNAQATVLAPTGTIGFMMDCDTTGIEPDIALVKYKLLAGKGDGMMKIVNQTVPAALARLGYADAEIEEVLAYIEANDTIEGAPASSDEHLPSSTARSSRSQRQRFIHHMGHVKMMAACQPFISGAISKTVNLPETAPSRTSPDAYLQGWKLGPEGGRHLPRELEAEPAALDEAGRQHPRQDGVRRGLRRRRGSRRARGDREGRRERSSTSRSASGCLTSARRITHKFSIAGHEGTCTSGSTRTPGCRGRSSSRWRSRARPSRG
jgi:ribonucleoside-diphosphate reductase alpha chain